MNKLANFQLAALLVVAGLTTGCVDNGDRTDCVGMSCPAGFFWPDGGEFRIQYVGLPDGTDLRFVTSFFIDDQSPETMPLPPFGLCGFEPHWTESVTNRSYVDVGPEVIAHMPEITLSVPRVENQTDFLRRTHDLGYLADTFEPATLEFFANRHTATLSPETAANFDFADRMNTLYMPPKLDVIQPQVADGGVLEIKSGQDLVVEWQEVQERDPNIMTGGLVAFDTPGSDVVVCIVPNNGRAVIPAQVIDEMLAGGGVMQVGTGSNEAILSGDERIIHQWGANCTLVPWVKVD